MHTGSADKKRQLIPKSIDDIDPQLIDVLIRFHNSNQEWKNNLLEAVNNFENFLDPLM